MPPLIGENPFEDFAIFHLFGGLFTLAEGDTNLSWSCVNTGKCFACSFLPVLSPASVISTYACGSLSQCEWTLLRFLCSTFHFGTQILPILTSNIQLSPQLPVRPPGYVWIRPPWAIAYKFSSSNGLRHLWDSSPAFIPCLKKPVSCILFGFLDSFCDERTWLSGFLLFHQSQK